MMLFGKYKFERLRDALQGVFEFTQTGDLYLLELWYFRLVISPHQYIELFVKGNNTYTSIGKILMKD